ncbi:MAG: hypothetical protein KAS83_03455, partial [Dehalococcoidia bacterium]|nr:hypothetical protein [Dehalococcoidia bacterium]
RPDASLTNIEGEASKWRKTELVTILDNHRRYCSRLNARNSRDILPVSLLQIWYYVLRIP